MGAGIRQRDDAGRVLQERRDAVVEGVEKPADEPGLQILLEAEVEEDVERVSPPFAGNIRDVPVHQLGILGQGRSGDDDAVPVSLEHGPRLGLAQILPEPVAEAGVGEHLLQRVGRKRLDRVEGRVGRQEAVEHLPRAFCEPAIFRAVEDFGAVDEDAVDAERVADRAGAAAGQVVDAAGG